MKAVYPVLEGLEVAAVLAIEGRIDLGEEVGRVADERARMFDLDQLFGLDLRQRAHLKRRVCVCVFVHVVQSSLNQIFNKSKNAHS